jgi:hypothetical protein
MIMDSVFPKPYDDDIQAVAEGVAIVIDGDTAPKAITSGQYLFIKNHSTLATGGYHATDDIASGGTVSSSNVAADADGVVNAAYSALNSKLIHDTFPVTCSYSANTKTETEITSTIAKTGYTPIIVVGYVISSLLLANIEESSGRYYILLRDFGGTSGTTTVNVHVLYQKS